MADDKETLEIPDGWTRSDNELVREVKTSSYNEAVHLTLEVANLADAMNHHPEIVLSYSGIKISVSSHDVGRVTGRDVIFALGVNALL